MNWMIGLTLYSITIISAIVALSVRDLMTSAVMLSVFSFLVALLYTGLGAVDVAFNEAVIGAGISGVFLVFTIFYTTRRSED